MTTSNPFGAGRSSRLAPWLGFSPALALFLVFALVPSLGVVVLSFTDISGIPGVPWQWVGAANYRTFFSGPQAGENWALLLRTLEFCFAVTVVQNALALVLAVVLNSRPRGSTFYRSVIFLPVVLGVTVIGLIWQLFFNPTGGPAASVWGWFGAESSFLGDPDLAFPIIIAVQIWASLGYSMMIFMSGLQAVPADLYEAARVDGAGPWQVFRRVTVPMVAPAITANVLISIIGALQTFQLIFVLTGDKPFTSVLALKIFTLGFTSDGSVIQQQGLASAVSMIQFVLVGIIALASLAYLRRRETQL
ncbi:carbohydrate ABC transporter permease [Micromonospora chersina]|uniref:carbohydrate ABC transporter permease n=1 Tax=Micromonospora chersina TaxID=47854 RepID=UPI001B2BD111|nr:sugar ABC transporter permease [Nonomuraea sp. TT08I-71]